jgi:hypothetical protein
MKPKNFPGVNIVFGEGQPQYQPLPALRTPDGTVITCWELSDEEIETITKNRCMYFKQATFNNPLQPIFPMADLGDDIALTHDEP